MKTFLSHYKYLLAKTVMVLFFGFITTSSYAVSSLAKTPSDVFERVMLLKQQVEQLRALHEINVPWPQTSKSEGIAPRHVLQKSLEVLDKIKRLRRIHKMGDITVPSYPSREVTPSEVYESVNRLVAELALFPGVNLPVPEGDSIQGKVPADVYHELWLISLALDPVLGIRGLKPTDVYIQSLIVLEQVKFLRTTQNELSRITSPSRTDNKHPNHSLQYTYQLLQKVALAEQNLWMEPVSVPVVPRREITSGEVYDALQIVRAELERLKYRLGVERALKEPEVEGVKTPDDVIVNLKWAAELMPDFAYNKTLNQYDQSSLLKTPSHVYALTEQVLKKLERYRALRGIKVTPRAVPVQTQLQSRHVFQKTLECLSKTDQLRQHVGLGAMALPVQPLIPITPTEVYELALRLDAELGILYAQIDMEFTPAELVINEVDNDKTPSDVFRNMWAISYMIDSVLGAEGYTPSDVFNQVRRVVDELNIIREHLNHTHDISMPLMVSDKRPEDVLRLAEQLMNILKKIKLRAGILEHTLPVPPDPENATPDDVYTQMGIILSELVNVKMQLGIKQRVGQSPNVAGKTPSHVFQQLKLAEAMMLDVIGNAEYQKDKMKPRGAW